MLSKEDYKNYLTQMKEIEAKMASVYKDCADKVEDDYIKKVCSDISRQEKEHLLIIEELDKLFNA